MTDLLLPAEIEDPLPSSRFIVTLHPADAYLPPAQIAQVSVVAPAEFKEVSGLGAELEVMSHAVGGVNDYVHQLPVRHSWSRISLKRGIVRDIGLWYWYLAGLDRSLGGRRDGSVILLTPRGTPAMAWVFKGGIAAKWNGPELNAMDNAIAVESLEIAHHGLVQIPLSPPGVP